MSVTETLQVHIVSHTHWDREWYLTYEQFRLRLVALVDRLLDMMESEPGYAYFHLDGQTIVLEDYLELRPHQEGRLRALIEQGRILIGPWYDMPDEFLVSGESLVRNLARGHRIAARFGPVMPVGYLPDLFGHVGQMPQILRHFGLDNAVLWRGFGGRRAEYWWEAPDGSRVLMLHLPSEGYCNATRVHLDPAQMLDRARRAVEAEAARTEVGEVLLMNGVDHVEPHRVIPELARQLAAQIGADVKHSTLPAYVDAVRSAVARDNVAARLEVIRGELRGGEDYANLLPGVFSARVYLKQANARIQTLLEKRAEPLAVFAATLGEPYPAHEIDYAWKTLLQNHPHDSICGCSVDAVHEENMTRFARAEQVASTVAAQAAEAIARAVPPPPEGVLRLVAINTTGFDYDGIIDATVDVPYASDEPRRVIDPDALDYPVPFWSREAEISQITAGQQTGGHSAVEFQVLDSTESRPLVMSRYETPWILRARRHRLALRGHVPACGYTTFDVHLAAAAASGETNGRSPDPRAAENAYVALQVNADGTVDITDKRTGVRYERCGELEDVADVGDEYNYSPPPSDRRITSADATDVRVTHTQSGALRTAFRIDLNLPLPAAITEDRSARSATMVDTPITIELTLEADSPRVGWDVTVQNAARDHRLRILFPTGADAITHVRAETVFGVAERAARREAPAEVRVEVPVSYAPTLSFTEAGSDAAGAIVWGDGLVEYEAVAGEDGRVSKLARTLLRSVGYLSREDLVMRPSGHAGPGLATPGAQCIGQYRFRLAFEPRTTSPSNTDLFARATAFAAPPLVVRAQGADGRLAAAGRFLEIDGDAVLSACYRTADDTATMVRLFNPDAEPTTVRLRPQDGKAPIAAVDFLEREQETVPVTSGVATVALPPYRIVTLKI